MNLSEKEDQSVDVSVLLRSGEENSHRRHRQDGTWVGEGRVRGEKSAESGIKEDRKEAYRVSRMNGNM